MTTPLLLGIDVDAAVEGTIHVRDSAAFCQARGRSAASRASPLERVAVASHMGRMLCAGAALQLGNAAMNVPYLSNSVAHWLGMTPADLFLYMFLPPLLLDSAVRTDYFVFKKVRGAGMDRALRQ